MLLKNREKIIKQFPQAEKYYKEYDEAEGCKNCQRNKILAPVRKMIGQQGRKPCDNCTMKHLAHARILIIECQQGYDHERLARQQLIKGGRNDLIGKSLVLVKAELDKYAGEKFNYYTIIGQLAEAEAEAREDLSMRIRMLRLEFMEGKTINIDEVLDEIHETKDDE